MISPTKAACLRPQEKDENATCDGSKCCTNDRNENEGDDSEDSGFTERISPCDWGTILSIAPSKKVIVHASLLVNRTECVGETCLERVSPSPVTNSNIHHGPGNECSKKTKDHNYDQKHNGNQVPKLSWVLLWHLTHLEFFVKFRHFLLWGIKFEKRSLSPNFQKSSNIFGPPTDPNCHQHSGLFGLGDGDGVGPKKVTLAERDHAIPPRLADAILPVSQYKQSSVCRN